MAVNLSESGIVQSFGLSCEVAQAKDD